MSNYPNIQAVIDGTVSGHATEWPQLRLELIQFRKEKAELEAQVSCYEVKCNELLRQIYLVPLGG